MKLQAQARRAFTLVELMVAAAVSIVIMTILATVFQMALDTMRQVRSQAEMADQLRAVGGVIQRDLGRDGGNFFSPDENSLGITNYGLRMSDWSQVPGTPTTAGGYLVITSPTSFVEGFDNNNFASTTATNHSMQFTNVLPGILEKDNYTAIVAGQTFTSPAAEIAYFLVPSGAGMSLPNGTPLFDLHRRQWLVAKTLGDQGRLNNAFILDPVNAPNVISALTPTSANTMQSVAGNRSAAGSLGTGDDILLSNVISFEVKVNHSLAASFGAGNTDAPFGNLTIPIAPAPATTSTFDSSKGLGVSVHSVQIRIRVYDPKVQTARQLTIVQDL